ncbi:hypothetical protein VTN31DRAFT_4658 [Thermomyces dupontii]|uniref:uncharacterized protein n=1 Tax=Talaromyces thermophilus TaxID=28565 RepID=UPI003743ED32
MVAADAGRASAFLAMQVAEILSDLTSLRACGQAEALALVNVNQPARVETAQVTASEEKLTRARELVDLHYGVKLKHWNGPGAEPKLDAELRFARENVNRVLKELSN